MYGQGVPTRVHREAYIPGYTHQGYTGRHITRDIPTRRVHREAYNPGYTHQEVSQGGIYTGIYPPGGVSGRLKGELYPPGGVAGRLRGEVYTHQEGSQGG